MCFLGLLKWNSSTNDRSLAPEIAIAARIACVMSGMDGAFPALAPSHMQAGRRQVEVIPAMYFSWDRAPHFNNLGHLTATAEAMLFIPPLIAGFAAFLE